jgi:hypothetical protein
MTDRDNEYKIGEFKYWAKEAIELLEEVKPYRSIFYKQRVAKLKSELANITHNELALILEYKKATAGKQ